MIGNVFKRWKAALLGVALTLAGIIFLAAPANAEGWDGYDSCPDGWVCAWANWNYQGIREDFLGDYADFRYLYVPKGSGCIKYDDGPYDSRDFNDCATSIRSRTWHKTCFYEKTYMQGAVYTVNGYSSTSHIGSWWNDKFSSFRQWC